MIVFKLLGELYIIVTFSFELACISDRSVSLGIASSYDSLLHTFKGESGLSLKTSATLPSHFHNVLDYAPR